MTTLASATCLAGDKTAQLAAETRAAGTAEWLATDALPHAPNRLETPAITRKAKMARTIARDPELKGIERNYAPSHA